MAVTLVGCVEALLCGAGFRTYAQTDAPPGVAEFGMIPGELVLTMDAPPGNVGFVGMKSGEHRPQPGPENALEKWRNGGLDKQDFFILVLLLIVNLSHGSARPTGFFR
jgi:hypothetical protein